MLRQPLLWIAVLGVLFFGDLAVHPGQLLYSPYSDLIPLHLPARRFLARSWQETGTVPLWCPNNLGGMPFIHDVQSSAFYPLHWPLLWLPERHQGAALSWLIVLHVILAGWFMYGYARGRGLESFGAFIAALGYMFAGKWLLHLLAGGHYNMVPLAWLPLVLLCLERGLWRRSLLWATGAGVAYALIVLSAYPYITLYVGLFVGLWTLGTVFDTAPSRGGQRVSWLRWLGFGVWTVAVAVLLSAVQLWPSIEAAGLASRSLGVPASAETITAGLWSLVGLVGSPLTANPDWLWENRMGLSVVWLALAALGVRLAGKQARWPCVACGFLLAFGCGGAALCQGLPGFRLFQLPSRILLLFAFPVSLLVGMAIDRLAALPLEAGNRRFVLKMMAFPILLLALLAVALQLRGEKLTFQPYWATLLVTLPAAVFLLCQSAGQRAWRFAWTGVLLLDLWGVALPLVAVRPEAELFAPSASVHYLMDRTKEHGRVLDVAPTGTSANNTPLWPGLPVALGIEPVRGFNPVDVLRYKEYLQFLTDHDAPLRPLDRMFTSAVLGGFPIRNQALADLLGIRYLVQPRDLALANTVPDAGARRQWQRVFEDPSPWGFNFIPATAIGTDCGVRPLPPYCIYENRAVLPRAFVVPEAGPLPDQAVLSALKATDFRRWVLLEDWSPAEQHPPAGGRFHPATIEEYHPNTITIRVDGTAGYLVLTDVWFPGWRCTVDSIEAPLYRADFLFRAVAVPAGQHTVVFSFKPVSYERGRLVSLGGCLFVACMGLVGVRRRLGRRRSRGRQGTVTRSAERLAALPVGPA